MVFRPTRDIFERDLGNRMSADAIYLATIWATHTMGRVQLIWIFCPNLLAIWLVARLFDDVRAAC